MGVLPRAGRERITRLLKADQVLSTVDAGARAAYELRASESEPGLKAGDDPKQLSK